MNKLQTFYWIGKVLSLDEHPEDKPRILRDIQAGHVNWNRFLSICDIHLILPAVYLKFLRHGLLPEIPEELSGYIMNIYALNRERNEVILDQIRNITETLNGHGLSPVYLKGSALMLDHIYSDIGERYVGDIDFLISNDEFFKTVEMFLKQGYYTIETFNQDHIYSYKHYPRLVREGIIAAVEIHHHLVIYKYSKLFDFKSIESARKHPANSDSDCYVLSDKDKIIHNFLNSQVTDREHRFANVSLRQLYDLYLLSRKADPVKALMQFGHFRRQAKAYLLLASWTFGLELPATIRCNLSANLFLLRHNLNLLWPRWHRASTSLIKFAERFPLMFRAYLRVALRATRNREYRRELFRRLREGMLFNKSRQRE